MGILNESRKFLRKIINCSYCLGQYYGEMKKIKNPRRRQLLDKVELSVDEMRQIDELYANNYGKKVKYDWHRLYQSYTQKFDAAYFPEYLFSSILEPKMNPEDYRYVLGDKLLLQLYCVGVSNVRVPHIYYTISNGLCFDSNRNLVNPNDINFDIEGLGSVIIKPVQDTSSGVGVQKVEGAEHIKDTFLTKAQDGRAIIAQECVVQHESLSRLYPNSVNTFRVITYIWERKIYHMPIMLRIGQGGNHLDNAHAGGVFIGVSDIGKLNDMAFTEFGEMYEEHPDTHIRFKDYKIDFVPEIIETAKKMHLNASQLGVISWDITVDNNGILVLIEANTRGQGIWASQMAQGVGAFGENTEEILKYMRWD